MKHKHHKAYLQGRKDFKAGKMMGANPYKYGGRAYYEWEDAMLDCYNKRFDAIVRKQNLVVLKKSR